MPGPMPATDDAEARTDRAAYDEQWPTRAVMPNGSHVVAGDHATMTALAPHVVAAWANETGDHTFRKVAVVVRDETGDPT
jgi:hypothetical protein